MNFHTYLPNETERAVKQLHKAANLFEMIEIESDSEFTRLCEEAGVPATLVRRLIRWSRNASASVNQTATQ